MVNAEVLQDFTSFPNTVGRVAQLLADGRSVCVILGDHEACTTTWDGNDIRAIAEKVELEPREDGRLGYLDRKNSRLSALRTSKDSPQWARIRPSWRKELQKLNLDPPPSEYELWRTALEKLPKRVEPYLSKARKKATDTTVRNILFAWPRIVREHRKQRHA